MNKFSKFLLFLISFVLLLLLPSKISNALDLNPSYLLLSRMEANVNNVEMVLLVTPNRNFSSGSELTIYFPEADDGDWCGQNDLELSATGVDSSVIDSGSWNIDVALPGSISARCYQGIGPNSSDRVVITGIAGLNQGVSYGVKIGANADLSTGPNVGINEITVQLVRGLQVDAMTFGVNLAGIGNLLLNAFVNDDNFSTLQVLSPTVERGIWSTIRVRVLDSQGNPIQGRQIALGIDLPDLTNWQIQQPTLLTNANGVTEGKVRALVVGLARITAKDTTFSQDILLRASGWLNVVNVPPITLQPLPMYSSGTSREINWASLGTGYRYYIECSLDPAFGVIFKNSGWITTNKHNFTGLAYGNAYYYRGRVRNVADFDSINSNIVSSIQAEQPQGVIQVLDPIVEKGVWSMVRITLTDSGGNPLAGRRVEFNIDRPVFPNWEIEQPVGLTNINGIVEGRIRGFEIAIVKVTAVDKTLPIEFIIDGHDWLQVTELPTIVLNALPQYSKGLSRNISWNLLLGDYQYNIEYSSDAGFTNVLGNSGWINSNSSTFSSLKHGQGYFYRGRVSNSSGALGPYSNVVWSIQDNEGPEIAEVSFDLVSQSGSEKLNGTFLITDLSGVSSVIFKCKIKDEYVVCGELSSSGNFHYVTISGEDLKDLRTSTGGYVLNYCMEARDIVGNQSSLCREKKFEIERIVVLEQTKTVEEPKPTAPIQRVTDTVTQTLDNFTVYLQDLEVDNRRVGLASVGLVSTAAPLTVFSFLANPGSFYYLGQVVVSFFGFFRRRRKVLPYGYVYDAVTKEPINRAIIRIYRGKKVVFSTVTNVYGVFFAALEEGEYTIKVHVNNYVFPTKLIVGNVDEPLDNIYKGEVFTVQKDVNIQYAIPLDPLDSTSTNYAKVLLINRVTRIMQWLQRILLFLGFGIAFFVYVRVPGTFNFVILMLYLPLLGFNLFLSRGRRKESFGIVKDELGKPLGNITLVLREMEFEKIATKRISNEKGQYSFLVPGGTYRLEVLNPGYSITNLKEKDLLFTGSVKKPLIIRKNLVVSKTKG